jgi:hexosaminidase
MKLGQAILRATVVCIAIGMPFFTNVSQADQISVVPRPVKVEATEGSFTLTSKTVIVARGKGVKNVAEYLRDLLAPATGMKLAIKSSAPAESQAIVLLVDRSRRELGDEGYSFQTTPQLLTITAAAPAGIFYGVQTLRQLLPAEIEKTEKVTVPWTVSGVRIQDQPRFKWRGYLIDPARHFRSIAEIKRYIDLLALHKLNVFHLHLTDDEGWRIEINKYPKLTETGSRIPDYSGNNAENWFYSQAAIKELLKYAAARFIAVIPEIEMPGHSGAATASYPKLSCSGQQSSEVCVSMEDTLEFECNVLNEVIHLFPSQFIHIGGDEVKPESWRACAACNAQLEQLNKAGLPSDVVPVRVHLDVEAGRPYYEDTGRLQGEFIRKIDEYISSKGRRMIGWDELLEGGLKNSSTARIMTWRSSQAITAATGQKREVIVSTYPDYYLDQKNISLQRTYEYDPVPPGLPTDQQNYIVGVQGNMWGEVSTALDRVDWYSFPRLSAISEVAWTPRADRDFQDFSSRLSPFLSRLKLMGVAYRADLPVAAPSQSK